MGDTSSKAKIFIDSRTAGNFQLFRVKSFDVEADEDLEVVKAVGVDGGAGFRDTTGGGGITLEVYRETGDPEVNWRILRKLKEKFSITIADEDNGIREQYQACRVAKVTRKGDDSGSNMDTVSIKWLRRVDLPKRPSL
jgi:hypothetical protein